MRLSLPLLDVLVVAGMFFAGAGYWAILLLPYGMLCYVIGIRRGSSVMREMAFRVFHEMKTETKKV